MIFKYEIGDVLKDKVTGFRGMVLGRTEYATGCKHYGLCPQKLTKEGKAPEWEWYDEMRLTKVGKNTWKKPEVTTSGIFPIEKGMK